MTADPTRLTSRVPPWADGLQLLDYLLRRFPYLDRPAWTAHLLTGTVTHNGARATPRQPVRTGDTVTYLRQAAEPWADTAVQVLHAEADFVVAVKPAHLPSHADGPFVQRTFIHVLRQQLQRDELALVHRLDRETSGVMVVAGSASARRQLEQAFRHGGVHKVYLAVVHGHPDPTPFTVTAPIGPAAASSISIRRATVAADSAGAQTASTTFTLLASGPARALLRGEPRTGRTHQIRVHLEHCGHPLVGDRIYGRPDAHYLAFVAAMKRGEDPRRCPCDGVHRHLLHAGELTFPHPLGGAPLHFAAPTPAEFDVALHAAGPAAAAPE